MIDLAYTLTGVWLLGWALLACGEIARDRRQVTPYFIVVHFVLTGLPAILDLMLGSPEYRSQPGFYIANQDPATALVYCSYVSLCPAVWWAMRRRGRARAQRPERSVGVMPEARILVPWRPFFWALVASPLAAVAAAPDPGAYLQYAFVPLNDVSPNVADYHQFMALTTMLSTLGATLLLASRARPSPRHLAALCPWLALAFWLNGKRTIVFTTLVLIGLVVWNRRVIRRGTAVAAAGAVIAMLTVFTVAYQMGIRGITVRQAYDSVRIDFARDNAIRMPLYAELHPDRMQILESRGQSLLFDVALLVPRAVWPEKPLPYAQYFTTAMLGTEPRMWGWGMTTTWLGEVFSNIGWFGLLMGPIPLGLMARLADRRSGALFTALTVLVGALLMAVQVVAFLPLFICWLALAWRAGRRPRRGSCPAPSARVRAPRRGRDRDAGRAARETRGMSATPAMRMGTT